MDLYLSKLIPLFIYPLGFALVLSIFATGILGLSAGLARLFLFMSVIVLWGASTPFFADYLGLTLEGQYPPLAVEETPTAGVIVVLGGGVTGPAPPRITLDLSDGADRVLHAARLYRAGKAPVVLISGGAIPWLGSDIPEAGSMQTLLEDAVLRQRLGKAGRKIAETRFSIQAAGEPFLEVYERLLGKPGNQP